MTLGTLNSEQAVQQPKSAPSPCDINRKSDEHWHLYDPHSKALAALAYTSIFKGAWSKALQFTGLLFSSRRATSPQPLSQSESQNSI